MDNLISKSELSRLILVVDRQLQDAKGEDTQQAVKLSYLLEALVNQLAEANNVF
jgi:hypothetical protein